MTPLTPQAERFIKLAKENRRTFLDPYRSALEMTEANIARAVAPRWNSVKNLKNKEAKNKRIQELIDRDHAEIIIWLLKLEPSHLEEPWILSEVVKWMRDIKYVDYLKEAFISQTERDRPTDTERIQEAKDFFLHDKIRRIREDEAVKTDRAIKNLADSQEIKHNPLYPGAKSKAGCAYTQIRKRYHNTNNKGKPTDDLPYPYWGYDIRYKDGKIVLFWNGAMSIGDGPRHCITGFLDINTFGALPTIRPHR